MARVLIISHDVVGSSMAGPGIRYWEMARVLSKHHQVTLAAPGGVDLEAPGLEVAAFALEERDSLLPWAEKAEVILATGYLLESFPFLKEMDTPLVIDLYNPFLLENLELNRHLPLPEQMQRQRAGLSIQMTQLQRGDFFLCACERQRDFWLGMLQAAGRLEPRTYLADPTLRQLIDVVPFGIPSQLPRHTRRVLKGVHPGIAEGDKVLLWGGGIWDWLDALSLIRAMALIIPRREDVKLFFMGVRHPNLAMVPEMRAYQEALALSQELGLLNHFVFFNPWVPYLERQDYLLEADLGVSLHFENLETRFSYRSRVLDYIWAALPTLTTRGDAVSELVEGWGLGETVEYGDVGGLAEKIVALLEVPKESYRPRFEGARAALTWEKAVAPLERFCCEPHRAADHEARVPSAGRGMRHMTPLEVKTEGEQCPQAKSRWEGIRRLLPFGQQY